MITYVPQPKDSKLCGQACLAMLCGITLDQAIKEIGHKHGTRTAELVRVLRRYGWKIGYHGRLRKISIKSVFPKATIFKMRCIYNHESHWIVVVDGKIFDPACEGSVTGFGRLTSFLEIEK